MRTNLSLVGGKGVNLDQLSSELAPGVWSTMTNFRSRAGFDELWEGAYLQYSTGSVTPLWGLTYATGTKYAVYCSSTKLYALNGAATNTEITRYTDGQVISSITAVGTTVTVNTAAAHGRTTGDAVDVWGCVPTTYNVTNKTITVVDADTFTYTADSAPATSPATVNGAYSYNVASNWSALTSGRYTGGAFNGLFLFNHPQAGLYYWNGDTAIRARKVPGFIGTSTFNTAVSVRPFKKFILALGQTRNGTALRQNVAWSGSISDASSLPTSFTSSSTNDAGETNLAETPGSVVDGLAFGDVFVVYLTDARYAMQYVGGSEVFVFTRLPGRGGLLAANCVVNTPLGQVFLTPDMDVMIHAGGEPKSIAASRVRQYLRDIASPALIGSKCFLAVNPDKNEVMVCYPGSSNATTGCDKALAWNWVDDTWSGPYDLTSNATAASGVTFATVGQWPNLSAFEEIESLGYFCYHATTSANTGLYYTVEGATTRWFEAAMQGTLERTGIDAGARDVMKTLGRSRPVVDGTSGDTASVYHGSSKFADTAPTYASAATHTLGTTDYCNARATQGRFLAWKLVTTPNNAYRLRSVDLDIAVGGKR